MKGKRAPELAAGKLDEVFASLCELSQGNVLAELASHSSLDAGERGTVLNDFGAARSYLQLGLQIKFAFWGKLPWKLCGIAHHDEAVARVVGEEVSVRSHTILPLVFLLLYRLQ